MQLARQTGPQNRLFESKYTWTCVVVVSAYLAHQTLPIITSGGLRQMRGMKDNLQPKRMRVATHVAEGLPGQS